MHSRIVTHTHKHRVGRVLSFFSSRRNWDSPNPSSAGECASLPLVPGERVTLAGERGGGWESHNSDERTYTVVLFICVFFVHTRTMQCMHSHTPKVYHIFFHNNFRFIKQRRHIFSPSDTPLLPPISYRCVSEQSAVVAVVCAMFFRSACLLLQSFYSSRSQFPKCSYFSTSLAMIGKFFVVTYRCTVSLTR